MRIIECAWCGKKAAGIDIPLELMIDLMDWLLVDSTILCRSCVAEIAEDLEPKLKATG